MGIPFPKKILRFLLSNIVQTDRQGAQTKSNRISLLPRLWMGIVPYLCRRPYNCLITALAHPLSMVRSQPYTAKILRRIQPRQYHRTTTKPARNRVLRSLPIPLSFPSRNAHMLCKRAKQGTETGYKMVRVGEREPECSGSPRNAYVSVT